MKLKKFKYFIIILLFIGLLNLAFIPLAGARSSGLSWSFLWSNIAQSAKDKVDMISVDPSNPNIIWAATSSDELEDKAQGLWKSTNQGKNWLKKNGSNLKSEYNVISLAINPSNSDIVYAGTYFHGIFKTTNGGTNWSESNLYLPKSDEKNFDAITSLAIDKNDPQIIYGGTADIRYSLVLRHKGVYKSSNGGAKWFRAGLNGKAIANFIINPKSSQELFAGTLSFDFFSGKNAKGSVWMTTNSGLDWTEKGLGLPSGGMFSAEMVSLDPNFTSRIYTRHIGWDETGKDIGRGVFKSDNRGDKWYSINNGLPRDNQSNINGLTQVLINPLNSSLLYLGLQNEGVFMSTNGGVNWFAENSGLAIGATPIYLDIYQKNPNIIYASAKVGKGTNPENGIWKGVMSAAPPSPKKNIYRLFGSDRYGTSIEISKKIWTQSDAVILARGDLFPDALAGSPLSAKYDAPILLTSSEYLNLPVGEEIKRLKAKEVYILGSEDAIYPKVQTDITAKTGITSANIYRLRGENRYETASKISLFLEPPLNKTAIIACGNNYPDALCAASLASYFEMPILLVNQLTIPDCARLALISLGINKTLIIGQPDVVPIGIENWLAENGYNPTRLGGDDRYQTCRLVADYSLNNLSITPMTIGLATGEDFPDVLSIGPLIGKYNGPILLVRRNIIPGEIAELINNKKSQIQQVFISGGPEAINPSIEEEVKRIIEIKD